MGETENNKIIKEFLFDCKTFSILICLNVQLQTLLILFRFHTVYELIADGIDLELLTSP